MWGERTRTCRFTVPSATMFEFIWSHFAIFERKDQKNKNLAVWRFYSLFLPVQYGLETEWERRSAETILLYKEYSWINMQILWARAHRESRAHSHAPTFIQSAIHFFSQRHIFEKRKKYMWFFFESKYDIKTIFFKFVINNNINNWLKCNFWNGKNHDHPVFNYDSNAG